MARVTMPRKMRQGMGVHWRTVMSAIQRGMCPLRAPTKKMRDDAKMPPFTAPNVEHATNSGMIHAIGPRIRFAKVCKNGNFACFA